MDKKERDAIRKRWSNSYAEKEINSMLDAIDASEAELAQAREEK